MVKSTKHANDNSDIDYLFSNKRRKKKVKAGLPKAEKKEENQPVVNKEPNNFVLDNINKYKQLKFKINKENFTPNNES